MNEFNNLVVQIAIVVLIGVLIIVGSILAYSKFNTGFPPYTTMCPSGYYIDISNNFCKKLDDMPDNKYTNRSTTSQSPTSIPATWITKDKNEAICDKYNIANRYNLFWDGITNNDYINDLCN